MVLFKVGLNENRRGGMCSAEEETVLGHPGVAFLSVLGGWKYLAQSCSDRQLVLPSKRGCDSYLSGHPSTIFEGNEI